MNTVVKRRTAPATEQLRQVPTIEQLRRSFVEARQDMLCAVMVLEVAEDRGWPGDMAEEMASAMALLRRAYKRIDTFEDGQVS